MRSTKRPPAGWRRASEPGLVRAGSRTPATTDDWLVLDTETTGLREDRELLEIAVLSAAGDLVFETLVRPNDPLPSVVPGNRIHGLGSKDLAGAPRAVAVLRELSALLEGRNLYSYGAAFDRRTLELAYRRWGLGPPPRASWTCILERYCEVRGFQASLRTACEIEGIEVPGGYHRARKDADLARQLLLRLQTAR